MAHFGLHLAPPVAAGIVHSIVFFPVFPSIQIIQWLRKIRRVKNHFKPAGATLVRRDGDRDGIRNKLGGGERKG